MAIKMIRVTIESVTVLDASALWGPGSWILNASIDGKAVGTNAQQTVRARRTLTLDAGVWSAQVDVSEKKAGDTVLIKFGAKDTDFLAWDHDLGSVQATLKFPFDAEKKIILKSPVKPKSFFFTSDRQYYTAQISVTILEATEVLSVSSAGSVMVGRQYNGNNVFSTVSGRLMTPRVEVCPVVPTPLAPSKLPRRPDFSAEVQIGRDMPASLPPTLFPVPNLNAMVNPSVIPVLGAADKDLTTKAARLSITYVRPFDLDTSKLTWHIVSGPVAFVGGSTGPEVMVRGTSVTADEWAKFEVRWQGAKPVLATFRAWVGVVKEVPYRVNLINGTIPDTQVILSADNVKNHLAMANVILWQSGISLVPDTDKTCYDSATVTPQPGIFNVPVTDDTWTRGVDMDVATPIATRLNYRVGTINIAYVRSVKQNRAAATDRGGLTQFSVDDSDTPSVSWVVPSGVDPDDKQGKLTLLSMPPTDRTAKPAVGDDDFIKARAKMDATFTAASLKALNGVLAPSDWSDDNDSVDWGVNIAHELGHVLGLRHRGSADSNSPPLSEDGINCLDVAGVLRGHPWNENVMTYGYVTISPPRAVDMDLLQAPVVRKFPLAKAKS